MWCQLSSTRVGVAAVDSSLGFINSFLEGLVPTEDSFAYVVEADGDVVGTSEQVISRHDVTPNSELEPA